MTQEMASSHRRLARIEELSSCLTRIATLIEELEGGMLIRELAAEDIERWGIVHAALADAQDVGAPGTVAAVLAILRVALDAE